MYEIKLRAWDEKNNRWVTAEEIELRLMLNPLTTEGGIFYIHQRDTLKCFDGIILTKFTGLFDRLGVEIYEGDIFIGFCKTKTPYIVKYGEDASFYGETAPHNGVSGAGKQTASLLNAPQWLEVIGNIYENPELAEQL